MEILPKLANYIVEFKAPTKKDIQKIKQNLTDSASKTNISIQPMSTLFDQALHIYGDIVSVLIIEKLRFNKDNLWKN